jgi:hypothetical protein
MSSWHEDALDLFRQARVRASQTSSTTLHLAFGRVIERMFAEGGSIPSDLHAYAQETCLLYGPCAPSLVGSMTGGYVG